MKYAALLLLVAAALVGTYASVRQRPDVSCVTAFNQLGPMRITDPNRPITSADRQDAPCQVAD